jgi:hypothetical protein
MGFLAKCFAASADFGIMLEITGGFVPIPRQIINASDTFLRMKGIRDA